VERMAWKRETCKLLAFRPEPERLIEKLSERRGNNIKKKIQTLVWRDISELIWIIIRSRARSVVDMVTNICFFYKFRKFLEY
jgi:hypothetical protein